jgi:hypothetical protein
MDFLTLFSDAGWKQHNLVDEIAIRSALMLVNDAACFPL